MNGVVRLYDRFDRWAKSLSRAQFAILMGIQFFVIWFGFGVLFGLFGELSLIAPVFGALVTVGAFYYFDPR